jgi:hypothetical protein
MVGDGFADDRFAPGIIKRHHIARRGPVNSRKRRAVLIPAPHARRALTMQCARCAPARRAIDLQRALTRHAATQRRALRSRRVGRSIARFA